MKTVTITGLLCALLTAPAAAATRYVDVANPTPAPPYLTWATAATNIQTAINLANPNDLILVTNGVYQSGSSAVAGTGVNRVYVNKILTLRSVNGPDVTVIKGFQVASTNGPGAIRCVYLASGAVLSGFTLTNGGTDTSGGGDADHYGGGVYSVATNSIVTNCVVIGNAAHTFAGGCYSGTLINCLVKGNILTGAGAGGGGAFSAVLVNCLLTGNRSTYVGGGAISCRLVNCTVVSNAAGPADYAGGTISSTLHSCIVYYNTPDNGFGNFTNCCVGQSLDLSAYPNCFSNAPLFVDPAAGDYRLQTNSPCINAGYNSVLNATNIDLGNDPRIVGGTVDVGAYEFQSPVSIISYAWLQQYGLPTDGSVDYVDTDNDSQNNFQEWFAGTVPIDPDSVLKMKEILTDFPGGLYVTWLGAPGKRYSVHRSTNLFADPAFTIIKTNVPSQNTNAAYFDNTATNGGPYFYRVTLP